MPSAFFAPSLHEHPLISKKNKSGEKYLHWQLCKGRINFDGGCRQPFNERHQQKDGTVLRFYCRPCIKNKEEKIVCSLMTSRCSFHLFYCYCCIKYKIWLLYNKDTVKEPPYDIIGSAKWFSFLFQDGSLT